MNNCNTSVSIGNASPLLPRLSREACRSSKLTAERAPPVVSPSQGVACMSVMVTWTRRARQAPSPPLNLSLRSLAFAIGTSTDASVCCARLRRPGLTVGLGHQCAKLARMKVHIRLRGQLSCCGPAQTAVRGMTHLEWRGREASGAETGPKHFSTTFHGHATGRKQMSYSHRAMGSYALSLPFLANRPATCLLRLGRLYRYSTCNSRLHAQRRWRAVEPTHQFDNT
jgi:hypothetical protein